MRDASGSGTKVQVGGGLQQVTKNIRGVPVTIIEQLYAVCYDTKYLSRL